MFSSPFTYIFLPCISLTLYCLPSEFDPEAYKLQPGVIAFTTFIFIAFILFGLLFWFRGINSYRAEDNPVKKSFFLKLTIIFFVWIIGPAAIYILTFALDPWVRVKAVICAEVIITSLGLAVMAHFTWFTRAAEYFTVEVPVSSNGSMAYEAL